MKTIIGFLAFGAGSSPRRGIAGGLLVLYTILCGTAAAELSPSQTAVLANSAVPESMQLAERYVKARNIPQEHIVAVSLSSDETIDRKAYDQAVSEVRTELEKRGLASKIRAIAVMYGVPLRVAQPVEDDQEKQRALVALAMRKRARAALHLLAHVASQIGKATKKEKPEVELSPTETDDDLVKRTDREMMSALERVNEIEDKDDAGKEMRLASDLIVRFAGFAGLAANLKPNEGAGGEAAKARLETLKREIQKAERLLLLVRQTPTAENYQRDFILTERIHGAVGVLKRADAELLSQKGEGADAAFDSELTLLWWDREMYPLRGRFTNPLYYKNLERFTDLEQRIPVLMVGRIDAPTFSAASAMIEGATRGESKLEGTVYVDSRGRETNPKDPLSVWDQNLRDFAWMIRRTTSYDVYHEKTNDLIADAPDTAVYVGWYSLRNYRDVFRFVPGAIGYHIASEEAISIRDPLEKGWCKNMLERGITATIGAVAEPYLRSFPLPNEFFGLLLSGNYSLAEAYYLTTPFLSWRMVLFGDPLYRPWQNNKPIPLEELKLTDSTEKPLTQYPTPLGEIPAPDPIAMRKRFYEAKAARIKKLDEIFKSATSTPST